MLLLVRVRRQNFLEGISPLSLNLCRFELTGKTFFWNICRGIGKGLSIRVHARSNDRRGRSHRYIPHGHHSDAHLRQTLRTGDQQKGTLLECCFE